MAVIKISDLTEATIITPTAEFVYEDVGANKKVTWDSMQANMIGVEELTIASGEITVTSKAPVLMLVVDTEGLASSDALTTINGTTPGQIITIEAASNDRTVVVTDSTGNIGLSIPPTFSLDERKDKITLVTRAAGGQVHELSRSPN